MNKIQTTIIRQEIGGEEQRAVDARQLHSFLEVGKDFSTWIKDRIGQYGFVEGIDFVVYDDLRSPESGSAKARTQVVNGYALTTDMAKELCMVERNAKGKEARMYFIEMERQAKQLADQMPKSLPEALRMAAALHERAEKQAKVIKGMAPKAEFHDAVTHAVNCHTIDQAAKILGTGEKRLFKLLREKGYLRANNEPYQKHIDAGLFKLQEKRRYLPDGEVLIYAQTLVTGKGIAHLQKKYFGKPMPGMSAAELGIA